MGKPSDSLTDEHTLTVIKERQPSSKDSTPTEEKNEQNTNEKNKPPEMEELVFNINDLLGGDLLIFSKGMETKKEGTTQEQTGTTQVLNGTFKEQKAQAKVATNTKKATEEVHTQETREVRMKELDALLKDTVTLKHENGYAKLVSLSDLDEKELQAVIDKKLFFTVADGKLRALPQSGYQKGQVLVVQGEDGNLKEIEIEAMTKEESDKITGLLEEYKTLKYTPLLAQLYKAPLEKVEEKKEESHKDVNKEIDDRKQAILKQEIKKDLEKKADQPNVNKKAIDQQIGSEEKAKNKRAAEAKDEAKAEKDKVWEVKNRVEAETVQNTIEQEIKASQAKDEEKEYKTPLHPSSLSPKPKPADNPTLERIKRKRKEA